MHNRLLLTCIPPPMLSPQPLPRTQTTRSRATRTRRVRVRARVRMREMHRMRAPRPCMDLWTRARRRNHMASWTRVTRTTRTSRRRTNRDGLTRLCMRTVLHDLAYKYTIIKNREGVYEM